MSKDKSKNLYSKSLQVTELRGKTYGKFVNKGRHQLSFKVKNSSVQKKIDK